MVSVVRLQASVPRETKLVITVQRASNLPRRLGAGGGGVRAVSPSRMTGECSRHVWTLAWLFAACMAPTAGKQFDCTRVQASASGDSSPSCLSHGREWIVWCMPYRPAA